MRNNTFPLDVVMDAIPTDLDKVNPTGYMLSSRTGDTCAAIEFPSFPDAYSFFAALGAAEAMALENDEPNPPPVGQLINAAHTVDLGVLIVYFPGWEFA